MSASCGMRSHDTANGQIDRARSVPDSYGRSRAVPDAAGVAAMTLLWIYLAVHAIGYTVAMVSLYRQYREMGEN